MNILLLCFILLQKVESFPRGGGGRGGGGRGGGGRGGRCQEDGLTLLNRVQAVGGGCVHTCQSSLAVSFIPEVQIRIGTEGGLVHTSYFW